MSEPNESAVNVGVDKPRLRLHRATDGDYRFDSNGVAYRVNRLTDGAAPSVVIWEVRRIHDGAVIRSYTTLTDLRQRWKDPE